MGQLKTLVLWSLAVVLFVWIPDSSCGSSQKPPPIKIVKKSAKIPEGKLPIASRRQTVVSGEDEENFSEQRPSYGPFSQGFPQGPSPYRFSDRPDSPSDRYDVNDGPGDNNGMGFMPEFGPPKGFPTLSKLTGGEFPKMDAPSSQGSSLEGTPSQYNSFPQERNYRPFPSRSPHGGPHHYYDESDDGPSNDGLFGGSPPTTPIPNHNTPKRKPHRSSRPHHGGGRFGGFGGPGGPGGPYGGPGPYGAPDGIVGRYNGPQLEGHSRPHSSSRRQHPFGGSPDGPSNRPSPYADGPGPFGSDLSSGPFGSDGPSSRPSGGPGAGFFGDSADGPSTSYFNSEGPPSRSPFGSTSDGPPSRPGFGSSPDGPPSRPGFGSPSDGPPSRPGFGSPSDGPPSRPGFGSPSDGPPSRPGFGSPSDGPPSRSPFGYPNDGPPSRPHFGSSDSPPSRTFGSTSDGPPPPRQYFGGSTSDGPTPRPSGFESFHDESSPNGPYDGPSHDGPHGRPFGGFDGPSRPNPFHSHDRPSRPGHLGGPPRSSSHSGRSTGPSKHGPGGSYYGRPDSPPAFSFSHTGPGFRLSRGYPKHHPNQIQNDDFKESADSDNSPFNGPPPPYYNYGRRPGPPRHQPSYRPPVDHYEHSPYSSDGPRSRRPEYSAHQNLGSPFGSSHRQDSYNRPVVLKESKYKERSDELPKADSYLVKSRVKRDLEGEDVSSTTSNRQSPCKSGKIDGCSISSTLRRGNARDIQKTGRKLSAPRQVRRSRRNNGTKLAGKSEDPMLADGTQQTGFWDVTAPFTVYNPFKKQASSLTAHDRHDVYEDEEDEEPIAPPSAPARSSRKNQTYFDTTSDEQRFFPSFPAPPSPYLNPFGNSGGFGRPTLFPGPTANRAPSRFHPQFGPKYTAPLPNRGPSSAYPAESHDRYLHTNLLGSGNFEVVRGGTYYGDDDDGYHHTSGGGGGGHYHHDDDDGYFHHNGHSSPHGYRGNPSAGGGGDFFANFRDFADINPPTRSFSHHHETVADAEPLGSASHEQPKNILDKLESSSDNVEVHQPYSSSRDSDPMMATF